MDEDRIAAFWAYRPLLYLFLIGMGAYLLANIANVFIASRIRLAMDIPEGLPRLTLIKPDRVVRPDYRPIITKNVFDPTLGIVVPPPPPPLRIAPAPAAPVFAPPPVFVPPPVVVPPKIPLNVRLIGTVVRADDPSYAVILDNRTGRQLIYRIGDFIREDAKIIQIDRSRVLILRGDEEIVLDYSGTSEGQKSNAPTPQPVALPPPVPSPPPSRMDRVRSLGENQWMLDRDEVDDAVARLPELMTKARVVPNFTDGKMDGFRIFAIQEDSLYAKIGLQNGDILQRVNNIDVRNPQHLLQVFERLKHEPNIRIELVRNNQEKTFDYIIR